MKKYSKVTLFFSVIFILLFIYLGYYFIKKEFHLDATPPPVVEYQKTPDELADSLGIQYRLEYTADGKMEQIIFLREGDAIFKMRHDNDSDFLVTLYKSEGEFIDTLMSRKGVFEDTLITIPIKETGAYLLDINTSGSWKISFR